MGRVGQLHAPPLGMRQTYHQGLGGGPSPLSATLLCCTGFLPSQQQWQQLVEACRSCGARLFSDEMCELETTWDGARGLGARGICLLCLLPLRGSRSWVGWLIAVCAH